MNRLSKLQLEQLIDLLEKFVFSAHLKPHTRTHVIKTLESVRRSAVRR